MADKPWTRTVAAVLPGHGAAVCGDVARKWSGANLYIPLRTARLEWRRAAAAGAAERFADDLREAVIRHGGTEQHARRILMALTQRRFVV